MKITKSSIIAKVKAGSAQTYSLPQWLFEDDP